MKTLAFLFVAVLAALCASSIAKPIRLDAALDRPQDVLGCNCTNILCMCCLDINLPIISESACAKMIWLQRDYSIDIRAVVAGRTLFDERFNATHSEKCLSIPVLGDTCFAMTNTTISNIGACGIFVLRFKYIFREFEIPFGDFNFGRTSGLPCPTPSKKRALINDELLAKHR